MYSLAEKAPPAMNHSYSEQRNCRKSSCRASTKKVEKL